MWEKQLRVSRMSSILTSPPVSLAWRVNGHPTHRPEPCPCAYLFAGGSYAAVSLEISLAEIPTERKCSRFGGCDQLPSPHGECVVVGGRSRQLARYRRALASAAMEQRSRRAHHRRTIRVDCCRFELAHRGTLDACSASWARRRRRFVLAARMDREAAMTAQAWHCRWCGKSRGILASPDRSWAVLVCPRCDFDHEHATTIPRENEMRDADSDWSGDA